MRTGLPVSCRLAIVDWLLIRGFQWRSEATISLACFYFQLEPRNYTEPNAMRFKDSHTWPDCTNAEILVLRLWLSLRRLHLCQALAENLLQSLGNSCHSGLSGIRDQ